MFRLIFRFFYTSGILAMLIFATTGCNECKSSFDCPVGQVCVSGDCTEGSGFLDTDSDADTDNDSDTDTDTDSDTDSDSDSDTDCTEDEDCNDDQYCTGIEKCVKGTCQYGQNPCKDLDDLATLCRDESFCLEDLDMCTWTPINEGGKCSELLFCLGNETEVCKNGACVDPPNYINPCPGTECLIQNCNEDLNKCTDEIINENAACNENNPCQQGVCKKGVCANKKDPCKMQQAANPCMGAVCLPEEDADTGLSFTCEDGLEDDDSACNLTGACDGTEAYCYSSGEFSACYEGQTRPCHNTPYNINEAQTCSLTGETTFECANMVPMPAPINVSVGLSANLSPLDYFFTREYYSYSSSCTGQDYRGMEAVLQLPDACVGKTTTITISNTTLPVDVIILHLTDYQDPSTCQTQGINSLTVANPSAADQIILESNPGSPQDFDLTVDCP